MDNGELRSFGLLVFWLSAKQTEGESDSITQEEDDEMKEQRRETKEEPFLGGSC